MRSTGMKGQRKNWDGRVREGSTQLQRGLGQVEELREERSQQHTHRH